MWCIYEIIHIWTAVVDESEEWPSQLIFQFKLERRSLKESGLQRDLMIFNLMILNEWYLTNKNCLILVTANYRKYTSLNSLALVKIFLKGFQRFCFKNR